MEFIAESVPYWEMEGKLPPSRLTSEDFGAAAPQIYMRSDHLHSVRSTLADKLRSYRDIGGGYDREKWDSAADAIMAGCESVRVYGRYYRIREVM